MSTTRSETKPPRLPFFLLLVFFALGGYFFVAAGGRPLQALLLPVYSIVIGLAILFVWAPIHNRNKLWFARRPASRAFDPDDPATPPEVSGPIREHAPAIEALGYELRGHRAFPSVTSNADLHGTFYEDRGGRTGLRQSTTIARAGRKTLIEESLSFLTKFADGTEVLTGNNRRGTFGPHRPDRKTFHFPQVKDPARLLALHRRAIAEVGEFAGRVEPFPKEPGEVMQDEMQAEWDRLARAGHLRLDPAGDRYRLTWKGAALLAWKHLFPVAPILRARRNFLAGRRLRAWEESSL